MKQASAIARYAARDERMRQSKREEAFILLGDEIAALQAEIKQLKEDNEALRKTVATASQAKATKSSDKATEAATAKKTATKKDV